MIGAQNMRSSSRENFFGAGRGGVVTAPATALTNASVVALRSPPSCSVAAETWTFGGDWENGKKDFRHNTIQVGI